MDNPLKALVLGPLVLKEIRFWLLMSPIDGMLGNLLSVNSHASRVSKAIIRIRAGFRVSVIVDDLVELAGMSQQSFRVHFTSVKIITLLQY